MLLPTGEVLFANGSANIQVYTPAGAPDPMWKPNITSVPMSLVRGGTYTLYGRQLNGLSQAVAYGDDATMATNYPIIRLRNVASGHVFYCRTFNHSTLGVNTGTVIHHTQFLVPAGAELGTADLTVVANGIASDPLRVTVSSVKKTEVKEIKVEVKEIKDTAKELKEKDAAKEIKEIEAGPAAETWGVDPDLLAVIRILAERADQAAEGGKALQPFIQEEERPEVGGAAIGPVYPASNPVKTHPGAQPQGAEESPVQYPPPSNPRKSRS